MLCSKLLFSSTNFISHAKVLNFYMRNKIAEGAKNGKVEKILFVDKVCGFFRSWNL